MSAHTDVGPASAVVVRTATIWGRTASSSLDADAGEPEMSTSRRMLPKPDTMVRDAVIGSSGIVYAASEIVRG